MIALRVATVLALLAATRAPAATLRVTSASDAGPDTLRQAIHAANRQPGSSIEIALGSEALILVERALPALEARGTVLEGGGATLREASGCERPRNRNGCDGLVVEGPDIVVRNLRVAGFLLDGISVHGRAATNVHIERVEAVDNLDDGIGVSGGAGPVEVDQCLLMGNGFRTKGKGLLVFDASQATLRDSVVIANRDGVTVTRDSKTDLERVIVAGSYDKGVGVSGAALTGHDVQVLANGLDADAVAAPNGDGVRVGLGGKVDLERSRIAGNGDLGIVVLDTARVRLRDCVVEANHGGATNVADSARLEIR